MDGKPDPGKPAKDEPEGYAFASAAEFSAWRSADDADDSTDLGDGYVSADGTPSPRTSRGARHGKQRGSFKLRRGREQDQPVAAPTQAPPPVEAPPVPVQSPEPVVEPIAEPVVDDEPPTPLSPDHSVHLDRARHLSDILTGIDEQAERLVQRIRDLTTPSPASPPEPEPADENVEDDLD